MNNFNCEGTEQLRIIIEKEVRDNASGKFKTSRRKYLQSL